MANVLQSGVASAERVFELLDAPEQVARGSAANQRRRSAWGRVEFEHVSFRYFPDEPLIEDLFLVAEPGHSVAIVGPTGAGKTTLVNLIMRFYELDSGRITLDGVDITQMARADLRSGVGMVLQDAQAVRRHDLGQPGLRPPGGYRRAADPRLGEVGVRRPVRPVVCQTGTRPFWTRTAATSVPVSGS